MIPLPRMGEYTEGIERINIELSLRNKLALVDRLEAFFARGNLPLGQERRRRRDRRAPNCWRTACSRRWRCCARSRALWRGWLDALRPRSTRRASAGRTVFAQLQDHTLARVVEDADPDAVASRSSPARRCSRSSTSASAIHERGAAAAASGWRCTCTPATATCTPTSRSTATTTRCCRPRTTAVARIMALARSLDGVISGEHGIGITKLEFLTDDELAASPTTSSASTPRAASTRASCCATRSFGRRDVLQADLTNAYTPSFGLMGHESLIMQQSDIGAIATRSRTACAAASASRCARRTCRAPTCSTARATRSSRPRCWSRPSSTRSRRGAASRCKHWEEFEDVADHCTVCHKCLSPCPVEHRLRRRVDEHAQPAAQDGPEELPPGQRGGDAVPQRDQPGDDQG